jgi:hypothetical protein
MSRDNILNRMLALTISTPPILRRRYKRNERWSRASAPTRPGFLSLPGRLIYIVSSLLARFLADADSESVSKWPPDNAPVALLISPSSSVS